MNISLFSDIDVDINCLNELYSNIGVGNDSRYFTTEQFNNLDINDKNNFSILCHNVRSLNANLELTETFIGELKHNFSAIVFTESWLNDDISHLIQFPNFDAYHSLRPRGKKGGGVSLFINSKYLTEVIESCTLNLPFIESLFVKITYKNKQIILACVYRPPNSDVNLFTEKLMQMIHTCNVPDCDNFILCGDFNIDLLKLDNDNNVSNFLNTCRSLALLPLIST